MIEETNAATTHTTHLDQIGEDRDQPQRSQVGLFKRCTGQKKSSSDIECHHVCCRSGVQFVRVPGHAWDPCTCTWHAAVDAGRLFCRTFQSLPTGESQPPYDAEGLLKPGNNVVDSANGCQRI
jgi:hypothetical protein